MVAALRMTSVPHDSCTQPRAVFIRMTRSTEIDAHQPVAPATPLAAWTSRALLALYKDRLKPRWVSAHGVVRDGSAGAHARVAQSVAEKASACGSGSGSWRRLRFHPLPRYLEGPCEEDEPDDGTCVHEDHLGALPRARVDGSSWRARSNL